MQKTHLRFPFVLLLVLATLACSLSGTATPDPGLVATAIAQTLAATTSTSTVEIPVTGDGSPTLTMTVTTVATAATPSVPQVRVSVTTNCRLGPGTAYEKLGDLAPGEVAEVVGQSENAEYWIIRNPDRSGETCWLWGEHATMEGNISALPQMTPMPRPTLTAGFDVFYEALDHCSDTGWWVDINVENIGGLVFRSMTLSVLDRDTGAGETQSTDGFRNNDGCTESEIQAELQPDTSVVVSSPIFDYDPTGHRIRATLVLCSELEQKGTCITQDVNLVP